MIAPGLLSLFLLTAAPEPPVPPPPPPPPGLDSQELDQDMAHARQEMAKAQVEMQKAMREMGETFRNGFPLGPRPVVLNEALGIGGDQTGQGVRITKIQPGSSAEKAGLRVGDTLTKLAGSSLTGADPDKPFLLMLAPSASHGADRHRLEVEYLRGGKAQSAQVRVQYPLEAAFAGLVPKMEMLREAFDLPNQWGELELVSLNPDLGSYFGTKEGLLVVNVPEDSGLSLKAGDVILKIGDRKPTSPMQAVRILRSYDPGETVHVEILRQHKHQALSITLPSTPA